MTAEVGKKDYFLIFFSIFKNFLIVVSYDSPKCLIEGTLILNISILIYKNEICVTLYRYFTMETRVILVFLLKTKGLFHTPSIIGMVLSPFFVFGVLIPK